MVLYLPGGKEAKEFLYLGLFLLLDAVDLLGLHVRNKYGYKCRHSMRSVDEGVTAVRDGIKVLGCAG